MKCWTIIILMFAPAYLFAQNFGGKVLDRETNRPVVYATVNTIYQTAFTMDNGEFILSNVRNGDTIRITSMGYRPYKMAIKHTGTDSTTIYLQQVSILLRDVSVRAKHDQKLDSIRNRKEFSAVFGYHDPGIKDVFITKNPYAYIPNNYIDAPNSTASIVSVNLLSVIGLLSKTKTNSSKLQQTLLQDENETYIDRVFSKQKVTAITGTHGDSLRDFMSDYRPTLKQAKQMTSYELLIYIKTSFADFIKNYDPKKQAIFSN